MLALSMECDSIVTLPMVDISTGGFRGRRSRIQGRSFEGVDARNRPMKLQTVARWHPILLIGVLGLLTTVVPSFLGWDYDQHGLATALFLLSHLFGLVFHFVGATLAFANDGVQVPLQPLLVSVIGLGIHFMLDRAVCRYVAHAR